MSDAPQTDWSNATWGRQPPRPASRCAGAVGARNGCWRCRNSASFPRSWRPCLAWRPLPTTTDKFSYPLGTSSRGNRQSVEAQHFRISQGRRIGEERAQEFHRVRAPEQLAVDIESRHAEHAALRGALGVFFKASLTSGPARSSIVQIPNSPHKSSAKRAGSDASSPVVQIESKIVRTASGLEPQAIARRRWCSGLNG